MPTAHEDVGCSGVDRKCAVDSQKGAFDPVADSAAQICDDGGTWWSAEGGAGIDLPRWVLRTQMLNAHGLDDAFSGFCRNYLRQSKIRQSK